MAKSKWTKVTADRSTHPEFNTLVWLKTARATRIRLAIRRGMYWFFVKSEPSAIYPDIRTGDLWAPAYVLPAPGLPKSNQQKKGDFK